MIDQVRLREMLQKGRTELDQIESDLSNSENFNSHTFSFIENRKNDLRRFSDMIVHWVRTDKNQILFTPVVYNEISSEIEAIVSSARRGSL